MKKIGVSVFCLGLGFFVLLSVLLGSLGEQEEVSYGGNLSGDLSKIYYFLKEKGLSDESIVAILGNFEAESRCDSTSVETVFDEPFTIGKRKRQAEIVDFKVRAFDENYAFKYPAIVHLGIGLCQWTNGRNRQLISFAKEEKKDWYDLDTQLKFFWMECSESNGKHTSNQWTRGIRFEEFAKETDIEKATRLFMKGFVGIEDGSFQARVQKAREYYQLIKADGLKGFEGSVLPYRGEMTEKMRKVVSCARAGRSTFPPTANYCAAWVSGVYQYAGLGTISGNAIDMWNNYKHTGSTDMKNIPPGAIVCSSGWGYMGSIYGHVGIYVGDGLVANNRGGFFLEPMNEFLAWNTATCQGHKGWIGWVMPIDLQQ